MISTTEQIVIMAVLGFTGWGFIVVATRQPAWVRLDYSAFGSGALRYHGVSAAVQFATYRVPARAVIAPESPNETADWGLGELAASAPVVEIVAIVLTEDEQWAAAFRASDDRMELAARALDARLEQVDPAMMEIYRTLIQRNNETAEEAADTLEFLWAEVEAHLTAAAELQNA